MPLVQQSHHLLLSLADHLAQPVLQLVDVMFHLYIMLYVHVVLLLYALVEPILLPFLLLLLLTCLLLHLLLLSVLQLGLATDLLLVKVAFVPPA